ncbi:hypothetical protein EGW08_001117 [Elysia chlorotica]|uniref:ShKT domain-containing protein n=1 Tax=Elysia chlorotica TaxID=188477 RepID=A0A3S1BTQ2_ELYCH|nr:hypothetical protein EGW08_001117 [Elysia chlorotica]
MLRATLLLAVLTIWTVAASDSKWDQAARDQVVAIHNEYRLNEGGCQMNKLEYDMELEAQAKKWALGCIFEHEHTDNGENLAFNTATDPESELIKSAHKAWFDEKLDYTRGQGSCSISCHYTQLVWDTTSKLGCYSTRCPALGSTSAKNAWYLVCFYQTKGNWMGEEPYQLTCDTPCRAGQTEEGGLCVGEVIVPCVDSNDYCENWAKTGECTNNPKYMEKTCRKACKICTSDDAEGGETGGAAGEQSGSDSGTGAGGETETVGTPEPGTPKPETPKPETPKPSTATGGDNTGGDGGDSIVCKDDHENCRAWAATSQCSFNPGYMLKKCRKSCSVCEGGDDAGPVGECLDQNGSCAMWAEHGHCKLNPGYMFIYCKKSCAVC